MSPNPSWSKFQTERPVTFHSFENIVVRFAHFDVGIGVVGYSWGRLSFPYFMDESVSVSGFVMNQWGVGGSVTRGRWVFEKPIPEPPTVVEEVEVPTVTAVGASFGHRVYFTTGSDRVSTAELARLRAFVVSLP